MKQARFIRPIGFIMMMIILVLSTLFSSAQDNLLTNPGFEAGFTTVTGDQPRLVAQGWTSYFAGRTSDMPSFQNTQPKYISASSANSQGVQPRTRNGSNAQIYYSFFETHDGGIYQQVSVPNGAELRFSIYAHIWSSTFDDVNVSEDPGGVAFRVGIDPTGGTNPDASSVVYSTPAVFYDTFRQYSVIATAQSSTVTVFVRSSFGDPVQNTYIYLDDAVLETTSSPPTVAPPTDVPTSTSVPATDVPATDVPATDAPTSVPATSVPTDVPPTTVPANTSVPQDATPTQETSVLLPTATPISGDVMPTTVPSVGGQDGNSNVPISDTFPSSIIHTVRSGDTVGALSVLYGSSTDAIIEANGLNENALIYRGQALVIPVRLRPQTATPTNTPIVLVVTATVVDNFGTGGPISANTYVVRPGDTLTTIAQRFNSTLATLVQLNGIANPNRIFVGQVLNVPGTVQIPVVAPTAQPTTPANIGVVTPPPPTTYVVQPGDNLYRIALRFGVSIQRLADTNSIVNYNRVFIGQVLRLPQ